MAVGFDDDLANQLRRQVAQVTEDKETAKLELESLRRLADSHVLRLNGALTGDNMPPGRFESTVQALDADFRGRLDVDHLELQPHHGADHELLRTSLSDAQKKCQVLNHDMLRVADANEELMGTLRTLKGTNKRLVEEVQKQTEELSTLTQQRLLNMENMTHLEDTFRHEKAIWDHDGQRAVEDERRRAQEEHGDMRKDMTDQLNKCLREARVLATRAGTVRAIQGQLKGEVVSFTQEMFNGFKNLEREVVEKIGDAHNKHHTEHSALQDAHAERQIKLQREKDLRDQEAENWRGRHKAMADELDDLVLKRDRDVSHLAGQVDQAHQLREAEGSAAKHDREALHDQIQKLAKDVGLLDAMVQTARRKGDQLKSRLAQDEGERDRLQAIAETLRQQIRESDEALGEAVRSNEALREQMEEQRLDSHSANERDLRLCKDMYEKRMETAAQAHMADQSELARKIHRLEEGMGMKNGNREQARELVDEAARRLEVVKRDCVLWKAQHELSVKMKKDVDGDLDTFRQDNIAGELRSLKDQQHSLAERKQELEARRAELAREVEEAQNTAKERNRAHGERVRATQGLHQQARAEHDLVRSHLSEAEGGLAAAKSDHASELQHMNEVRDRLEQDVARVGLEHEVDKRDLERKVQAERQHADAVRASHEKLRSDHQDHFRRAHEEPGHQASALEAHINELQRGRDAEVAGIMQKADRGRQRAEEVEGELVRLQAKLSQTEREVQEGTAQVSQAKTRNRTARETLASEKTVKTEELHRLQRRIAERTEQVKGQSQAGERNRRSMLRGVEDAKALHARQLSEADGRMQALKTQYGAAIEEKAQAHRANHSDKRSKLDALVRENEQLRRHVSEQRHAASPPRILDAGVAAGGIDPRIVREEPRIVREEPTYRSPPPTWSR